MQARFIGSIFNFFSVNSAINFVNDRFYFNYAQHNEKVKIKFNGRFSAIITCNGSLGATFITIIAQGYGPTSTRTHISEVMKGVHMSYEILSDETGIMVTCSSGTGTYSVSIFMIEGVLIGVDKI